MILEEGVSLSFAHLSERVETEFSKSAKYFRFSARIVPSVTHDETTDSFGVQKVVCQHCKQDFEIGVYQQDLFAFEPEYLAEHPDIHEFLMKNLKLPNWIYVFWAVNPFSFILLYLGALIFGFLVEGTSLYEKFEFYGPYFFFGYVPIYVIGIVLVSIYSGKFLTPKHRKRLRRNNLGLGIPIDLGNKIGLPSKVDECRRSIVRAVNIIDLYGDHKVVSAGNYKHTDVQSDTMTTTTVEGEYVWSNFYKRPENQDERLYEIGVKTSSH